VYPPGVNEAIDEFKSRRFDSVIVGAGSSDISVADLLVELQKVAEHDLEVLAYSPEGETPQDFRLAPLREGTIVRRITGSARLLNEVTRILHVADSVLPEYKRLKLDHLRQTDHELVNSRVLIVDDDVRNIFALTSILERHQIQVLHAENGRAGIDTLMQTPDIDVVLMDIMMPGMDGYETIRAIREVEAFKHLPIIAVTAKAMKGDREKCIESGASDYIAKPVDLDQLFSLMRVWTHERRQKASSAGIAV
jgi:CheY-like chemotaxis protein